MENRWMKFCFPMVFAASLIHAEFSDFTKNQPLNYPFSVQAENSFFPYDNQVNVSSALTGAIVTYERIKPNSVYCAFSTVYHEKTDRKVVGASFMAGYNFLISEKDRLTPMVGYVYLTHKYGHVSLPVIGVDYQHKFNKNFGLGAFLTSPITTYSFAFSVGTPITYYFGSDQKWEFRVTPTFTHAEHLFKSTNRLSIGCSLGYCF